MPFQTCMTFFLLWNIKKIFFRNYSVFCAYIDGHLICLGSSSSSSSSSSSPLLSLVQVPAKLAINLSIHTQHTYDNGVDRTGRQGIKKNTAFTWGERGGKKKIFNPQTMLHLEYSLRTEKKTPQHKSTYTINTWLATGETYPALASSRPVQCHLLRRRSQTCSP